MSDLHRAVQDEIDAHTPAAVPPFDALAARRRSRHRRRLAVAGTALSAVAVAAVLVPSLGTGGDRLAPGTVSAPGGPGGEQQAREYAVTNRSDTGSALNVRETDEGIRRCLELPGVTGRGTGEKVPVDYAASVDGDEQAEQFEACLDGVPRAVRRPFPAGIAWTGASVCLLGGGVEDGPCRELGASEASALQAVLDRAVPDSALGSTDCGPHDRVYRVLFQHPAVRAAPSVVPLDCGSATRGGDGGAHYRLDAPDRDRVKQAYDKALPARTAAFIDRCAGAGQQDLAPEVLGLTEDGLRARLGDDARWRLVGQDGECLVRADDLRPERVNVLIEDGRVVWAARS